MTKPDEVKGLLALGGPEESSGYKGYGLAMMVEILCGILSGKSIFDDKNRFENLFFRKSFWSVDSFVESQYN